MDSARVGIESPVYRRVGSASAESAPIYHTRMRRDERGTEGLRLICFFGVSARARARKRLRKTTTLFLCARARPIMSPGTEFFLRASYYATSFRGHVQVFIDCGWIFIEPPLNYSRLRAGALIARHGQFVNASSPLFSAASLPTSARESCTWDADFM